ncbi:MAG: recombinase family protein, partial [Rivularia sp. (in: cyanobacteria)]
MDVWGYARVSTDEQADDEGALIKQMRRLRSAGATKLYYDVESRTSDKRKGLLRLIEDI